MGDHVVCSDGFNGGSDRSPFRGLRLHFLKRRGRLKPSTRAGYQSNLDRHVLPTIGDLRLADVSPIHIEQLLGEKGVARLSPKSVRNVVNLVQGIFALALDNDLIARSPVRQRCNPQRCLVSSAR